MFSALFFNLSEQPRRVDRVPLPKRPALAFARAQHTAHRALVFLWLRASARGPGFRRARRGASGRPWPWPASV